MGSSIFTGSGIKIYSNFGIRDKKIRSKNGISLKKIYLATTLLWGRDVVIIVFLFWQNVIYYTCLRWLLHQKDKLRIIELAP